MSHAVTVAEETEDDLFALHGKMERAVEEEEMEFSDHLLALYPDTRKIEGDVLFLAEIHEGNQARCPLFPKHSYW